MEVALAQLREERDLEAEAARLAAAQADAVEAALAEARATAAAQEASLAQLAAQLGSLEAEGAALQTALDTAEAEALREAAAAEALRDTLATREAALTDAERARVAEMLAAETLRARLEGAETELTAMGLALEEERRRAEETLTLLAAAEVAREGLEESLSEEISERDRLAGLRARAEQTLAAREAQSIVDQRRVTLLNRQVADLREQVGSLQDLLGSARTREARAESEIESLSGELNLALAELAAEQRARADLEAAERARLERFQSEFFGQLRDVLEGRDEIEVVGDRFMFSSEVLFELGSADLATAGREQIANVEAVLSDVSERIPPEIDWILRVDGHTDNLPLSPTARFSDNWELSQARALSVVRFLTEELGFPPERLAATGFGEFRPVDPANTPQARARNRRIELKLTER